MRQTRHIHLVVGEKKMTCENCGTSSSTSFGAPPFGLRNVNSYPRPTETTYNSVNTTISTITSKIHTFQHPKERRIVFLLHIIPQHGQYAIPRTRPCENGRYDNEKLRCECEPASHIFLFRASFQRKGVSRCKRPRGMERLHGRR